MMLGLLLLRTEAPHSHYYLLLSNKNIFLLTARRVVADNAAQGI